MRELRRQLIPDDDTGAVLRQMLDDGDDLDRARPIDFIFVFPAEDGAAGFAAAAGALPDLDVSAPEADDEGIWEVVATRTMVPAHRAITVLEGELTALAQVHGGFPDGWACPPATDPE
ncbi:ribonuclease E inhibitor RraB [Lysobacter korlensis]|uniref:Ribonuclease E inhibitor RraB n=1 Tax=Lysobacter korlensis TaxID=553636 RepID=A0ABV6RKJ6_9GAMM